MWNIDISYMIYGVAQQRHIRIRITFAKNRKLEVRLWHIPYHNRASLDKSSYFMYTATTGSINPMFHVSNLRSTREQKLSRPWLGTSRRWDIVYNETQGSKTRVRNFASNLQCMHIAHVRLLSTTVLKNAISLLSFYPIHPTPERYTTVY